MKRSWTRKEVEKFRPEDLLHFIYLDEFQQDWEKLHPLDNDQAALWMLEMAIMSNPDGPPVIPGTGGLRKLRLAHETIQGGKSGGTRVCYAYFPEHHSVVMVIAYAKNEQDNLTSAEKTGIKNYLLYIEQLLNEKA